jgi:hypothetical protein
MSIMIYKFKINLFFLFLSVVIALISIRFVFDIKILNPRFDDWLYISGDTQGEYAAWIYYRNSPILQWPLTLNDHYAGSWNRTLIFSAVPVILAIPIKYLLLAVNYDGVFQYQGLQILLSWTLFIFFSIKILYSQFKDLTNSMLASMLLLLSPVIIFRNLFPHYTFNLIWIIPASLYVYQTCKNNGVTSKKWGLLIFIAGTWMPYFVLFPFGVWLALITTLTINLNQSNSKVSKLYSILVKEKSALVSILVAVIGIVVINGLTSKQNLGDNGLGFYGANLNSLVNPKFSDSLTFSNLLPDLSYSTNGQYEGFSYLGIPIISLLVIGLTHFLLSVTIRTTTLLFVKSNLGLFLITLVFILLATGGLLSINEKSIKFFEPTILPLLNTFRATGRLMMFVALFISFLSLSYIFIIKRKFTRTMVLSLLLAINFIELNDPIKQIRSQIDYVHKERTDYNKLFDISKVEQIEFFFPEASAYPWKMNLILAAAKRNIPVNDGFFARSDFLNLQKENQQLRAKLSTSSFNTKTLYVFYPTALKDFDIGNLPSKDACFKNLEDGALGFWIGSCE